MKDTYRLNSDGRPEIKKTIPGRLDYIFDWSEWLQVGEVIAGTPVATVVGDDTLEVLLVEVIGAKVVVWLTGGTNKRVPEVRCRITTNNTPARIEERTILVRVVISR